MRTRPGMAVLAIVLAPWGCTMVATHPSPEAPPAAPEPAPASREPRQFGGRAHLGGQAVEMVLELTPVHASADSAVLRIPDMSVEARGEGTWKDGSIRLELRYGNDCAGIIRLRLDLDDRGEEATGTLEATDCTGSEEGPVTLLRRGVPPPRPLPEGSH